MDGTLIDTEPYWMLAQSELVDAWGGQWSHEEALSLVGAGLWNAARVIQDRGVHLTEDEIVDHLTDRVLEQLSEFGAPWRPGAIALLQEIRDAGIPTALVTMSVKRMADRIVAQLGFTGFDLIVSGEDVEHPKPHPAPYLQAATQLGVEIERCIALEDSVPGVASAVASGAVTIAVPFMVDVPESEFHASWPSLEGRGLRDLKAELARVKTP
ncbi:MAG: HAD family hydrolase [Salinibacterium sp.]|nr:HAD family hydrolase [Salinibacterium sp.]